MASQSGPIKVMHFGLGPIGAAVVKQVANRKGLKIVGGIDIDPAKVGRDLGEVAGVGRSLKVKVSGDARKAIKSAKPDVVVLCTSSSLKKVLPQIEEILKLKVAIVSTTEELAYPTKANLRYARVIHQLAKKAKVAVLGTGVNPGFVMDKLPLTATSVCQSIESIDIIRIQNASTRREPLQRKVGAGMTRDEFRAAVDAGKIKHMGLRESLLLVGHGLGIEFTHVSDERIEPIVAQKEVVTQYLKVAPGQVAGVHQTIDGKGPINVRLELRMYVGAEDVAADRVIVKGVPNVELTIKDGVHGDRATAAMVVNSIPRVRNAKPGVLTMDDIPISFR